MKEGQEYTSIYNKFSMDYKKKIYWVHHLEGEFNPRGKE